MTTITISKVSVSEKHELMLKEHSYEDFVELISNYATVAMNKAVVAGERVYHTDIPPGELYDIYLSCFAPEDRQRYTCKTCEAVLSKYGNLATVNDEGICVPVMWNADMEGLGHWRSLVRTLQDRVTIAKVKCVFVSDTPRLEVHNNGEYAHFHIASCPSEWIFASDEINAMKQLSIDQYKLFTRVLFKHTLETLKIAEKVLEDKYVNEIEQTKGAIDIIRDMIAFRDTISNVKGIPRNNLIWKKRNGISFAYLHFNNTVGGSLLDDIVRFKTEGKSLKAIIRSYNAKIAGENYRQTRKASDAQMKVAKKKVDELQIGGAFKLRYLTIDDVRKDYPELIIWDSADVIVEDKVESDNPFDSIIEKKEDPMTIFHDEPVPVEHIHISKFLKLLPEVAKVELDLSTSDYEIFRSATVPVNADEKMHLHTNIPTWYSYPAINNRPTSFHRLQHWNVEAKKVEVRCILKSCEASKLYLFEIKECYDSNLEHIKYVPTALNPKLRDIRHGIAELCRTDSVKMTFPEDPEDIVSGVGMYIGCLDKRFYLTMKDGIVKRCTVSFVVID